MIEYTYNFIGYLAGDLALTAPLLAGLLGLILAIGLLIGRVEGWSVLDSVYHAAIAATSVGYGDFKPTRPAAKLLSILLAFSGVIFIGLLVALCVHSAQLTFELYDHDL